MTNIWSWSTIVGENATADGSLWPEGQLPSSVNDGNRDNMASIARWRDDSSGKLLTTGSGSAYVLALATPITALADGMSFSFQAHAANPGAATLNASGTGAKQLVKDNGIALGGGELVSGGIYTVTYAATGDQYRLHGISATYGTDKFVNVAGDTMTGALFVAPSAPGVALMAIGTPDAAAGFVHLRASVGQKAYFTISESTFADKWGIGCDPGSRALNFREINTSGPVRASLSEVGRLTLPFVAVTDGTHAVSYTTGALTVAGGVGVGTQIYSGGHHINEDAGRSVGFNSIVYGAVLQFQGGGTSYGMAVHTKLDAYPTNAMVFHNHALTPIGSIVINIGGVVFNESSDLRLKREVRPYEGGLAVIEALQVHQFEWAAAPGEPVVGLVAQEVNEVYPQAVTPGNQIEPQAEGFMPWMMASNKLVAPLIAAVQELSARVQVLEAQLAQFTSGDR